MRTRSAARGVALPVTLLALIVVVGFVMSVSTMNQGLKSQVFHSSNHQWSFLLAYSAMSKVLAKIHTISWGQRPFATGPYRESKVPLQGGLYDLFVENTPGKDYQADIYVRTTLAGLSRLYFWRITFNDDLLDVSNRIMVEFFRSGEPEDYPTSAGPSKFSQAVDALLVKRAANQKHSDSMAVQIAPLTDPKEVLAKINGRAPTPFNKNYPGDTEDTVLAAKPAVPFPVMQPPQVGELPTAGGPGGVVSFPSAGGLPGTGANPGTNPGANPGTNPGTNPGSNPGNNPGSGFPSLPPDSNSPDQTMTDLSATMAKVTQASQEALDKMNAGINTVEGNGGGQWDAGQQDLIASGKARTETYDAMGDLVSAAKQNLANAPSAEAAKAMEEMVSSTMVAAYQNIANAADRYTNDFADAAGIMAGQPTSAEAEKMLTGWEAALKATTSEIGTVNGLVDKIKGFSMTSEAAGQLKTAQDKLQAVKTRIEAAIEIAKARVAELKAQEAAAAAAAAGGTPSPSTTDPTNGSTIPTTPPIGGDPGSSGDLPAP